MAESFFFYDLETSGVSPRNARIMQFAGQRTDMELNPVGEPFNILVKLSDDVLPDPDAVMITGITPQKTLQDGITEAEFFRVFTEQVAEPGTIFVGFNSIRFDDEFMRYGLYRNFYDAYEWQWKDGRSKWDILDLVRTTRALRPSGIEWPFASDGKPANRLEMLTSVNNIDHQDAHDALSDVRATIAIAKLIKDKQPKLFDFMLKNRGKKETEKIVTLNEKFIYVCGMYATEHEKLTVAHSIGAHHTKGGVFVYDLRHDPAKYVDKTVNELVDLWKWKKDTEEDRLPVKVLQFNKCPAVAPTTVLLPEDAKRLSIDYDQIGQNLKKLKRSSNDFYKKIIEASKIIDEERVQTALIADDKNVDAELYNGFFHDDDKNYMQKFRVAEADSLSSFYDKFDDKRLRALVPLYKARNYPKSLTDEERADWENFRGSKLKKLFPKFANRLQALAVQPGVTNNQQYLLEELHLYAESIMPTDL